jgi:hypothetical protein
MGRPLSFCLLMGFALAGCGGLSRFSEPGDAGTDLDATPGDAEEPRVCTGNFVLNTLAAFSAFTERGCTRVEGNLAVTTVVGLTDLRGLERLTEVTGNAAFGYDPDLTTLAGLGGLERVGALVVTDNPLLPDLVGLERLEEARLVYLQRLPSLVRLRGLERLKRVTSSLLIEDAASFEGFDGLDSLESITRVAVNRCPSLTSLRALAPLTSVFLIANDDPSLASLAGLERVTALDAVISDCNALSDLSALSAVESAGTLSLTGTGVTSLVGLERLRAVHVLELSSNAALTSLSGLEGLASAGGVAVNDNPELPQCAVDELLLRTGAACLAADACGNNDAEGTCP